MKFARLDNVFTHRVTRKRFWLTLAALALINAPFWGVIGVDYLVSLEGYDHYQPLFDYEAARPLFLTVFLLLFALNVVAIVTTMMGRMRDRGREPRLVPLGFALFIIWRATEGRWEALAAGEPLWWAIAVPTIVYLGWLFIELGLFAGMKGENRFGPDPRKE